MELDTHYSWDGRHILRVLSLLFRLSLTNESPRYSTPPEITVPLRPHQQAILHAMESLEKKSLSGSELDGYRSYANFGILGDEVGTGKSLCVLSHIARMKHQNEPLTSVKLASSGCPNMFTTKTQTTDANGSTLIVIPHTIYKQWEAYAKNHTNLKGFFVKTKRELDETKILNAIQTADFTLVSNTLYSDFMTIANQNSVVWKRMFFDEADSIYITSTAPKPHAGFLWFITASWANLLLHQTQLRTYLLEHVANNPAMDTEMVQWLKNEIGSPAYPHTSSVYLHTRSFRFFQHYMSLNYFRGMQVIRCRQTFMDESMTMPPIKHTTIVCKQNRNQKIVQDLISPHIQQMLHGGDVSSALEALGVKEEESTNLVNAVLGQKKRELTRLRKTLEFKEQLEYASEQTKEQAIQSLKSKIQSLEQQIETFEARLASLSSDGCPICYEEPSNATITPCCNHVFCGACILSALVRVPSCPMCRAEIALNTLIHISKEKKVKEKKKEKEELLKKEDALLQFLKTHPEAKVLVFSRYENPFAGLQLACIEAKIDVHVLKGNKDCISNTIKAFESGEKRVLFLPTQTAAAGMNLTAASHIVLYHTLTPEEERQVIGRAHRLGRKESLEVVHLVHEGEVGAS